MARRQLVQATVIKVNDCHFYFPSCVQCYSKLQHTYAKGKRENWYCPKCHSMYSEKDVNYRYRISLKVMEKNEQYDIVAFGKCLEEIFGLPANNMVRYLSQKESPDMHQLLQSAVHSCVVGLPFLFALKSTNSNEREHRKSGPERCDIAHSIKCAVTQEKRITVLEILEKILCQTSTCQQESQEHVITTPQSSINCTTSNKQFKLERLSQQQESFLLSCESGSDCNKESLLSEKLSQQRQISNTFESTSQNAIHSDATLQLQSEDTTNDDQNISCNFTTANKDGMYCSQFEEFSYLRAFREAIEKQTQYDNSSTTHKSCDRSLKENVADPISTASLEEKKIVQIDLCRNQSPQKNSLHNCSISLYKGDSETSDTLLLPQQIPVSESEFEGNEVFENSKCANQTTLSREYCTCSHTCSQEKTSPEHCDSNLWDSLSDSQFPDMDICHKNVSAMQCQVDGNLKSPLTTNDRNKNYPWIPESVSSSHRKRSSCSYDTSQISRDSLELKEFDGCIWEELPDSEDFEAFIEKMNKDSLQLKQQYCNSISIQNGEHTLSDQNCKRNSKSLPLLSGLNCISSETVFNSSACNYSETNGNPEKCSQDIQNYSYRILSCVEKEENDTIESVKNQNPLNYNMGSQDLFDSTAEYCQSSIQRKSEFSESDFNKSESKNVPETQESIDNIVVDSEDKENVSQINAILQERSQRCRKNVRFSKRLSQKIDMQQLDVQLKFTRCEINVSEVSLLKPCLKRTLKKNVYNTTLYDASQLSLKRGVDRVVTGMENSEQFSFCCSDDLFLSPASPVLKKISRTDEQSYSVNGIDYNSSNSKYYLVNHEKMQSFIGNSDIVKNISGAKLACTTRISSVQESGNMFQSSPSFVENSQTSVRRLKWSYLPRHMPISNVIRQYHSTPSILLNSTKSDKDPSYTSESHFLGTQELFTPSPIIVKPQICNSDNKTGSEHFQGSQELFTPSLCMVDRSKSFVDGSVDLFEDSTASLSSAGNICKKLF